MELQQLRCFVAVARTGSIARAATSLHLTPAPVSRSVKALEQQLGCELVRRGGSSLTLTAAGLRLFDRASELLASVNDLQRVVAGGGRRGLRVGAHEATPMFVLDGIVELIGDLVGVPVDVSLYQEHRQQELLEADALDFAVVHLHRYRPHPEHGSKLIAQVPEVLAMRADDPLAAYATVSIDDVPDGYILMPRPTTEPSYVNDLRSTLMSHGVQRFWEHDAHTVGALAAALRFSGGAVFTVDPAAGGPWRVFDDPAFVTRPVDVELTIPYLVIWSEPRRRDDHALDAVVSRIEARRSPISA